MANKVSSYGKITFILAVVSIIAIAGGCIKENDNKIPEKNIYYYSTPDLETNQTQASTVWEKINRSEEAKYVTSESSFSAIVFAHPYTVGMFDPSSAEWIVILFSIPENKTEIKIAMFRLDYLTHDMKISYEFSLPAGEELSLEQSIAIMEEEMKKDTYGSKSVEREKVILQGGNYIYSYPAGDFGGTIIVNKYAGKAVFYATTVWDGKGQLIIPDEEISRNSSLIPKPSPPGSTISKSFDESSGIFTKYWDAWNFPGFWRDSETNVSTETLVINQNTLNNGNRIIGKHNLIYTTRPVSQKYLVYARVNKTPEGTDGFYTTIGWLGEKYVLLDGNRLAKIIFEQNASDAKMMTSGDSWLFEGGHKLLAQSIEAPLEKQAWLVFLNGTNKLDDIILSDRSLYSYQEDPANIPIFITYISSIRRGPYKEIGEFNYTWLRSQQATEPKVGDTFGIMEVMSINNGTIELRNRDAIGLASGTVVNLMGNISIQVDSSDAYLSFHPFKTRKT